MNNEFAAYHEAGHAIATERLGGEVEQIGLTPTPHCIPDVDGVDPRDIATICMGGMAATLLKYDDAGAYATDYTAAENYDDPCAATGRAVILLSNNWPDVVLKAESLIAAIGEEKRFDKCHICVDTVRRVMDNGCDIEAGAEMLHPTKET